MKIIELEMTCWACPEQYRGRTECGKEVYARERHGHVRIDLDGKTYYKADGKEQGASALLALVNLFEIPNEVLIDMDDEWNKWVGMDDDYDF